MLYQPPLNNLHVRFCLLKNSKRKGLLLFPIYREGKQRCKLLKSLNEASGEEPACQCRRHEMQVQSLGWKVPWRRKWQHTGILAWKIPWREEPGGPQSTVSPRVRHDYARTQTHSNKCAVTHYLCKIGSGQQQS